jgi:ABC-type thiamin/hydroxymethylpyrimidine transport system permease subunit
MDFTSKTMLDVFHYVGQWIILALTAFVQSYTMAVSRQQQFNAYIMDGLPCTGAPMEKLVLPRHGSYCALTVVASLFRMIVAGRLWNF